MRQTVFLIAGPSGSGKTTLTQALIQRVPGLTKVMTVTTRLQRVGEVSGVDYIFVTSAEFYAMEDSGELIECDHAFNESYGVPRAVRDIEGDVAINLTVSGVASLNEQFPRAINIFIMPSSFEVAADRGRRGTFPTNSLE